MRAESNRSPQNGPYVILILATLFALVAIVVTLFLTTTETELGEKPRSFQNIGGDFTLLTNEGEKSLSNYHGEVRVLYFGFTRCAAVCPASMATIARALNKIPLDNIEQVRALMISIDPENDTPEVMSRYVASFHDRMVGMTGQQSEIDTVTRQYAVYQNLLDEEQVKIEHTSRYYIIDRRGDVVAVMRHSTTVNELATKLLSLL